MQVHISPDSRYILLPLLEKSTTIKGWVIYDSVSGVVLEPKGGPSEGVFGTMHEARDWVTSGKAKA